MNGNVNYEDKRLTLDEEWRDIAGYEGRYQVSNLGKVRNIKLNHILKPLTTIDGYYRVDLSVNNQVKHYRLHKLVALAFLPNTNNYPVINHKDENKTNNRADNLEWCTNVYNANYGTAIQRRVANTDYKNRKQNRRIKKVLQFTFDNAFVKRWESANACEAEIGIRANDIRSCCRGERATAHGYVWRYAEE